jgi:Divergent InlB B-repeat domain
MRLPRLSLLAAPLLTLALLAAPASALGAAIHPLLQPLAELELEDACGVARHGGELYVSDYYHDAIDRVNPEGKRETQIANESTGAGPCKLEFDSGGDLYVNNWHENVVKYNSGELLTGAGTVVDSASPTGLAVQQSSGDLYVAHRTYVSKYDASGALLETIGSGHLQEAYGVAVSEYPATAGDLYVPDAATHTVKVFGPTGNLIEEMNGEATPQGRFLYLVNGEIAVDNSPSSPSYGHVFVLDAIGHGLSEQPEAVFDEFNAEGDYRGQITGFTDAEPSGIAIDAASHNVYFSSGNSEGSAVFVYGPTEPAHLLEVTKAGTGGGTVRSSPSGIVCGPTCAAEYNEGQTVTLVASPDAHSVFTGWNVTGSEECLGTGTCTVVLANTVEVHANFEEPAQQPTLTVTITGEGSLTSAPEGISCPGSCAEHFNQGRLVTLTAHPAPNRELQGWSGCTVQANPDECNVTMSAAKAVSVSFEVIPQLPLAVSLSGSGQGTVSSSPPAISCPGSCSSSFDEGSTVYLMAAPSPGSGFAGFSGGGCAGTATLCAVPMSSAQNVTATFTGTAAGPAGGSAASSGSASLAVASVRTAGNTAVLSLKTSEAGTLVAGGPGLEPLKRKLPAGATTLRLHLGPAARKGLERRGHLALRLSLGFLPSSGAPGAARALGLHFHAVGPKAPAPHRPRRR